MGPEAGGHLPLCSSRLVLETVPYIKDKNFSNVIQYNRLRMDHSLQVFGVVSFLNDVTEGH